MRVIPVIDLKAGLVVRGVGGRRDRYRPVASQLVRSAEPVDVAAALADLTSDQQLYLADLDAIAGAAPAWSVYEQVLAVAGQLIVDAGLTTEVDAARFNAFAARQSSSLSIAVALESSGGPDALEKVFQSLPADRAVFSLDLKEGRPLTAADAWQHLSAVEIAGIAAGIGFRRMIILDLSAVGVDRGPLVVDLCRDLRAWHPRVELISGGGVRSIDDLELFHGAGCDGVLVASALHDGRITSADLRRCPFLQ